MENMIKMTDSKSDRLDIFINQTIKSDLEKMIINTITDEQILSVLKNGKRLRPILSLLAFKSCTQGKETIEKYQSALDGCIIIELAHTASLVHDDIIDKDNERRGVPSYHVKKGISNAILIGHKMIAIGLKRALDHGNQFAKLYVDSWHDIISGEIKEVNFDAKNMPTKTKIFEIYNKIIEQKTSLLFSSSCKAGAIEAKASSDVIKVFMEYGKEIGFAYQLADDFVDLTKGELLNSVIVPLLNRIEDETIVNTLSNSFLRKKLKKNESKIKEIFIEEIKNHIAKAEDLSKSSLIPESQYKDMLLELPTYIVNRILKEIDMTI